jgi:hypothetical protein
MRAASAADADYLQGYDRWPRRAYHGEAFGTQEEHDLWLSLASSPDGMRAAAGRGYHDGFAGELPAIEGALDD